MSVLVHTLAMSQASSISLLAVFALMLALNFRTVLGMAGSGAMIAVGALLMLLVLAPLAGGLGRRVSAGFLEQKSGRDRNGG